MLWRMAWRNLWRRKRRTLITLGSVAFGVWLSFTFTGMGGNTYNSMIDTSARMGFGHLTIHPAGWLDSLGLDHRLVDAEALAKRVSATPGITGAYVRISGQAMFATANNSTGGVFYAIHPGAESAKVDLFVRSIVEGRLFDEHEHGIVVGKIFAEKLGLRLDKRVVYTMVDANGEIVSDVARVSGIFETGVDDVDGAFALLPIERVRKTLGYGEKEATLVAVFIDDHRKADHYQGVLGSLLSSPDEVVSTWKKTQSSIAGLIQIDRSMNYLFQTLIAILIAAGVLNTILMSVLERKREFGVMMAVGSMPSQLFGLVTAEAFMVGIVGSIVGVILSGPWYLFMSRVGIDISGMYGADVDASGVLIDPVLRLHLFPENVAAILIGVFLLTMLAGLYPAWQAGRDPPVQTLKEI